MTNGTIFQAQDLARERAEEARRLARPLSVRLSARHRRPRPTAE